MFVWQTAHAAAAEAWVAEAAELKAEAMTAAEASAAATADLEAKAKAAEAAEAEAWRQVWWGSTAVRSVCTGA